MAKRLSQFLGVGASALQRLGAFNALIGVDNRLFVDPLLLKGLKIPELRKSRKRFEQYFREVLFLLARSKSPGDKAWREARDRLIFRETKGVSLGYGLSTSDGSGIGRVLGGRLLNSALEIVGMGINDPEMFELLGLFEKDFGPDRLSDMTIAIIKDDLFRYSERITKSLGLKNIKRARTAIGEYALAMGPNPRKPIVFVPGSILRPLPIAQSWDEIEDVVWFNQALRNRLNNIIHKYWKKGMKVLKENLRGAFFSDPKQLQELLSAYRRYKAKSYDLTTDPLGLLKWFELGQEYAQEFPIALRLDVNPSLDDIQSVVRTIITQFRRNIEENGLNIHLYDGTGVPLHERFSQRLFFAVADAYCKANNIDISPEANSGTGPVDFKFSRGYQFRVLAEIKLSSNQQVVHGFRKQLPTYEKSEKTNRSAYVVIRVDETKSRMQKVQRLYDKALADGKKVPELFIIDGRRKPTASKR